MSNYEYFELKYLEEVNELFLNIRELSGHYDMKLFEGPLSDPMDLFDFVFRNICVLEEDGSDDDFPDHD